MYVISMGVCSVANRDKVDPSYHMLVYRITRKITCIPP